MKKSWFWSRIREYLLLGLISILPIVLTLWVLFSFVGYLDQKIYSLIPGVSSPKDLFGYNIPGLGMVLTFFLVLFAGILAKTITGKVFNRMIDSGLGRVPVVRGLYRATKQISGVFFSQEPSAFKHVVLVPFPYAGVRAIGFLASAASETESYVFVPTSPNPTSGYILIYANKDIEESPMSIEEAIQLVISGGAVGPEHSEAKVHGKKG